MRSLLAFLGLIFVSAPAFAIINEVDGGKLGVEMRKSTVTLMQQYSGNPEFHCSAVLVGRRYVLTAYHCVAPSESLWYGAPEKGKRLVEFISPKNQRPQFIAVKSIDYPKELKAIHKWGIKLDLAMGELENKIKGEVFTEFRRGLIVKLGGDANRISDYSGEYNDAFLSYSAELTKPLSDEQRQIFVRFGADVQAELTRRIQNSLQQVDALVQSFGWEGSYADFEKYVHGFDLALLELAADAPANYTPVTIGRVDLHEGSDLTGWAAGAGNFGKFGDSLPELTDLEHPVVRIGSVKIVRRESDNHLVMRAGPSRICKGDSGGPLFIEQNGKPVLVGIHASVDFANDQEKERGAPLCLTDIETRSMDLAQFPELLKRLGRK